MDIIGMTSLQEAKLAREAEICYAAMAMVTDFDCWRAEESEVNVETVVQNLKKNISLAKKIIRTVVPKNIGRAKMYMCPGLEKRDYDRSRAPYRPKFEKSLNCWWASILKIENTNSLGRID